MDNSTVMSDEQNSNIKRETSKFKNVTSEKDSQFAVEINHWLFKPLGLWPMTKETHIIFKILAVIRIIACLFLLTFVTVPGFFLFLKVKGLAARIEVLTGPFIFYVMSSMKYLLLIFGQKDLSHCLGLIIADWREIQSANERNIMIVRAKYGRMVAVICASSMYTGGILYAGVFPQISGTIETEDNKTIRPFAFPGYYKFFDPQNSPAYEIVYCLHCCCAFVMLSVTCATCSLAVVFVMHACGQLEITSAWLKDLVAGAADGENSDTDTNSRFSKIIQHHVKTLRFINNIDKLLCQICLVEVVGCTISICVLGYNVLVQWSESGAVGTMAFGALLLSFTSNIFLVCFIGELLIAECKKVGETVYMIDWYQLPKGTALGLTLTIVTAQNPVVITAGKIVDLSLRSFATIMRTSVAYLNILRTFQE